jgi:hypothetical protein
MQDIAASEADYRMVTRVRGPSAMVLLKNIAPLLQLVVLNHAIGLDLLCFEKIW